MKTPATRAAPTGADGQTSLKSITITDLLDRTDITDVWQALGGDEPRNGRARAFWRDGKSPRSVSIDEARGCWCDHGIQRGGGVLDLVQTVTKCDRRAAVQWLADHHGVELDRQSPAARQDWRRRHAEAEAQAASLIGWRDNLILGLRGYRNNAWARAGDLEREATALGPDSDRAWTLTAESTDARRAGDALDEYADIVQGVKAMAELLALRRRLEGGAAC